jgi:crotonobetainyl-CoA:carnitine CoA-transferase CaiB-like acyl-CoA transferase
MTALNMVRVLDLSTGITGPVVGMFLGDFGADVVKVESPLGDPGRGLPGFTVRNRNKKSVVVDVEVAEDLEWLAAQVAGADVCILGNGPSLEHIAPALGAAAASNGRLITVRTPVYLEHLTPWAGGHESSRLLAALGGQAMRQSSYTGGPIDGVSPFLLYFQGVWAATCTVAALVERTRSGHGQEVIVTGANAVMAACVGGLTVDVSLPDPDTRVGPAGRHPTYRHFICADKTWIASGALGPKFEEALLRILGLESEVLNDPRIACDTSRYLLPENRGWAAACVERAVATWQRDDLIVAMRAAGIPVGPLLDQTEWLDHPQVAAAGLRAEIEDPERGPVVMPGVPFTLTRTPGTVRTPGPQLGEHDGIAPWSPQPPVEDPRPLAAGPLNGVRVLNLGTFVATPYAGFLLAELGADVIKVEPLTGDPFRVPAYSVNRGMRSVAIDLKNQRGQQLFHRLVAVSDVVIDGMRPGVMRNFDSDYDSLVTINPSIVTMSLSGYGEGDGPMSADPGVDMIVQAISGMMSAQGGRHEPVANTIAINDVTTAAMSALTCLLALFERAHSGRGQRTWDSLAGTATYLQMDDVVWFEGRPAPARGGQDFRGPHALHRYYPTSDQWICVDAADDEAALRALAAVGVGHADLDDDELADVLGRSLGQLDSASAAGWLNDLGIAAAPARRVSEVLRDPQLLLAEFSHIQAAAGGGFFSTPGRYAAFSRTPRFGPLRPPGVGEHTREVLDAAGLTADEIDAALADHIIATGDAMPARLTSPYR